MLASITFIFAIFYKRIQVNRDIKMANDAALSMDADHQEMLYNMGDPAGVYGNYDSYTMPLTRPFYRNERI